MDIKLTWFMSTYLSNHDSVKSKLCKNTEQKLLLIIIVWSSNISPSQATRHGDSELISRFHGCTQSCIKSSVEQNILYLI